MESAAQLSREVQAKGGERANGANGAHGAPSGEAEKDVVFPIFSSSLKQFELVELVAEHFSVCRFPLFESR